ncbi:hypothetical protein [Thalassospira marina]|uniref:Uncharacterized protein n=1 Tax=Thalassospira marina TaxID=2048283 RepID=A0A2N3KUJ4_9PROT|nr:hypothetical protein COO20_08825 [Thalassospira marina]
MNKKISEWLPVWAFIKIPILALLGFGFWGMGVSQGSFMDWLDKWQSLIGAFVGSLLAVGLFLLQRKNDLDKSKLEQLTFSRNSLFDLLLYVVDAEVTHRIRMIENSDEQYAVDCIEQLDRHIERCKIAAFAIQPSSYLPDDANAKIKRIKIVFMNVSRSITSAKKLIEDVPLNEIDLAMMDRIQNCYRDLASTVDMVNECIKNIDHTIGSLSSAFTQNPET